jgi:glutathione S-transferase
VLKLYTAAAPNGRKVSIALEELALAYEVVTVDLQAPEHPTDAMLRLNPT